MLLCAAFSATAPAEDPTSEPAVLLEVDARGTTGAVARMKRATKAQQKWIKETEYSKEHLKNLKGRFEIEDEVYDLMCTCLPSDPPSTFSTCYPREVKIESIGRFPGQPVSPDHPMLDAENLRRLLGAPEDLRMVEHSGYYWSAPDGRSSDEVLGTWGGDAGELFLKFAVWEDLSGQQLRPDQAKALILRFLRYDPRPYFYMHTDTIALAWAQDKVGATDWFDPTNPPPAMRASLLDVLVQPLALGSVLLQKIAKFPDLFGVRRQLLPMFVRALYEVLWDPEEKLNRKIRYYVLHSPGTRRESAWVEFDVGGSCLEEGRYPAFPPFSDGVSVFVHHPRAIEAHRNRTASILRSMTGGFLQVPAIQRELKIKGDEWRAAVEDEYGPLAGLPKYRVTVSPLMPSPKVGKNRIEKTPTTTGTKEPY
jgi:hypothetical protein